MDFHSASELSVLWRSSTVLLQSFQANWYGSQRLPSVQPINLCCNNWIIYYSIHLSIVVFDSVLYYKLLSLFLPLSVEKLWCVDSFAVRFCNLPLNCSGFCQLIQCWISGCYVFVRIYPNDCTTESAQSWKYSVFHNVSLVVSFFMDRGRHLASLYSSPVLSLSDREMWNIGALKIK